MNRRMWRTIGLAAFAALVGVLSLGAGQASANFANFSLTGSFGTVSYPESIAVDESTGDVYVLDIINDSLDKFDAGGNPVNFSALSSNAIPLGEVRWRESQVAVDNSSGPAKGDIYVARGGYGQGLLIYGPDGKSLGELSQAEGIPWGTPGAEGTGNAQPCGVAVNRAGSVYLGLLVYALNRYATTANPVTSAGYSGSLFGTYCEAGVDVDGNVYASRITGGQPVYRYDPSQFGAPTPSGTQLSAPQRAFVVANSFSKELFVVEGPPDRGSNVVQYDAADNALSTLSTSAVGVGFNAKTGTLYVANEASRKVEIWQGTVSIPSLQTGAASGLSEAGSATLNGAIEPEETPVSECVFEYGTSGSYGATAPCAQAMPLTGGEVVAVSAPLSKVMLDNEYHYRLTGTNANGTAYGADKTFAILVLPSVEDRAPEVSSVARATANLVGTVNPEQGETAYHFDIGTTTSYGNSTPISHLRSGLTGDVEIAQRIGELRPETTYHYRLVASNIAGRVVGADHTFTTGSATPPGVVTGGTSKVSENDATVAGTVDTRGLPTTYGFEIGTSTDYGPPTGLGSVGAGLAEAPVSLTLTGLQPGTTYHYRLMATNVDGTSYGADQTFTTSAFPETFVTPPAPLPFVATPTIVFPAEAKAPVAKKKAKTKRKKVKRHAKHGHSKRKAKGKKKWKAKGKKK